MWQGGGGFVAHALKVRGRHKRFANEAEKQQQTRITRKQAHVLFRFRVVAANLAVPVVKHHNILPNRASNTLNCPNRATNTQMTPHMHSNIVVRSRSRGCTAASTSSKACTKSTRDSPRLIIRFVLHKLVSSDRI